MSLIKQGTTAIAAFALAALLAAPADGAGDYGPDTCLQGYVWREATPVDHVCVTPGTRAQAAADNAAAASRRNPAGGPYGPDTCNSPYVWREVTASDHVCVTLETRGQAAADNAAAAGRRASINLWLTRYRPDTTTCSGDVCAKTSDDAPRYKAVADHINVGGTRLFLRRLNGKRIASWFANAAANPSAPGGVVVFRTDTLAICDGPKNAYFQLQDLTSGRLSPKRYVTSGCKTL